MIIRIIIIIISQSELRLQKSSDPLLAKSRNT